MSRPDIILTTPRSLLAQSTVDKDQAEAVHLPREGPTHTTNLLIELKLWRPAEGSAELASWTSLVRTSLVGYSGVTLEHWFKTYFFALEIK